ncbi:MAG TPA: N-acetylmuramoyl-L-alanine amidase [Terriglobales bacterium]|nr:N-acetylmuramoyl-L-alanine amidase [Terriglobales bacterium]
MKGKLPDFAPFRLRGVWALAVLVLLAAVAVSAQTPDALSQAHAMHLQLLRTPVAERQRANYDRIVAVLAPLWSNPRNPDADSARFEAASLYVARARDLHDPAAYALAAQTFLALLRASPYTAYRRNAEFALAQIQIFHLHEPRAAAVWLRDFDQRYPADLRADVARREARGLKVPEPEYLTASETLRTVPASSPPAERAVALPPAPPPSVAPRSSKRLAVHIGNLNGVQVFSNANGTSVVVALRREAPFTRGAIPQRHLTYFDISARGAPRSRGAGDATLRVDDGRVVSIRIADHRSGQTRLVIETRAGAHTDRGRYFPNPARLIIGITGAGGADAGRQAPARPAQPALPLSSGGDSLTRALGLKIGRIVLDPGHGGHDTGTIGADDLLEKNVVLDVALRLGKLLRQRLGVEVLYTRHNDTFIPLEERTAIANRARADLFVSIHANSNPDPQARGIETYYLDLTNNAQALAVAARENASSDRSIHDLGSLVRTITLHDKMEESHELARDLQRHLSATSNEPDRGVKSAPFVVLIGAQMPSVLAEISFLSNPGDDRRLRTSAYRQRLAEGLYQGLLQYIHSLSGTRTAALAGSQR